MATVIQPPATPGQGRAPQDGPSSARPGLVRDIPPEPVHDSGQGLALFMIFTTAVLVITVAIAFLALLTSWWVLGIVFGLDMLVTVVVGTAVFAVLGNGKLESKDDNVSRDGAAPSLTRPIQARTRSGNRSPIAA